LQSELDGALARLPGVLRSDSPETMLDYLATVFDETDGQPAPCLSSKAGGSEASSQPSNLRWTEYERHLGEHVQPADAQAEIQQLSIAARTVEHDITEMDAAAFEISGLDAVSKLASCSGRMELVRCDQCLRIMLAPAFQAHVEQCRGPMTDHDSDWGGEMGQGRSRLSALGRGADLLLDDGDDTPDWDPARPSYAPKPKTPTDSGAGRKTHWRKLASLQNAVSPPAVPKKRKPSAVDVRAGVLRITNSEHIRSSLLVDGAPPQQRPRKALLNIIHAKLPQVVSS